MKKIPVYIDPQIKKVTQKNYIFTSVFYEYT